MPCPICEKRKPKRFCPAKGEKICAVCCGTEREVTIDCPTDCPYLLMARRYEEGHSEAVAPEELPYPDVEFPPDVVHEHQAVVAGLAMTILKFIAENRSGVDADVLEALSALAETYRTLGTGIYYEKPPHAALPHALYDQLGKTLEGMKNEQAERAGFVSLKNSEIFHLLVFMLRVGRQRTNGRARSRAFLDFLRAQFPRVTEAEREASRIITP